MYMSITRAGDFIYAMRIIKLLVTPWERQAAFKHGIIDKNGKLLKKFADLKNGQERDSFTYLHRIVFNLKRLLSIVPGGKTFVGAATASLLLLKESFKELELSDESWDLIYEEMLKLQEEGVAGAPTNVTGSAVSTDTPKGGKMARRTGKFSARKKKKDLTDTRK